MLPPSQAAPIPKSTGDSSTLSFFCWSCGVKLAVDVAMKGMCGPCPQCQQVITAPGVKEEKKSAVHYLREEGVTPEPTEVPSLQIEVQEEFERSLHLLPGLLPIKIGDVVIPAFRVVRRKPMWMVVTQTLVIIALALTPFVWLWTFYFPESEGLWAQFNAYRLKQIEFVERQIRSSREAQAVLDRQERVASSRPEKPLARAARQAVAVASQGPAAPAPAKPSRPPPPAPGSRPNSATSFAAAPPVTRAPAAMAATPASVSTVPPVERPPGTSPYEEPPPDTEHMPTPGTLASRGDGKEEWPQILLRNNGIFAGHSPARGACSFLVDGDNGSVWLATSVQMLGDEGGVRPPVNADRLAAELYLWRAYFPGDESSFVDAVGGDALVSAVGPGWLALKIASSPALLPASPVKLRHNPPAAGETVYLVGLPAGDRTGASQHLYAAQVTAAHQEDPSQFGFTLAVPFPLSGFTGAPIVDVRGDLVGVLTGGHTSLLIGTKADRLESMIRRK